ncbi:MAG: glycosyltransferase [Candidatus Sericytochromatia bacterium]
MLSLPHRLLIGPLFNPALLGAYAGSEQIRLFMPSSAHTRDYAYDLVYRLDRITDFSQIFAALPPGWEPELVLWWDPVYQPIPPGIEACPYPTALIPGDWNLAFGTVLQAAQSFDAVFADARLGPILTRAGIPCVLPWPGFAFDASELYLEPGLERIHDICFIGNMNPSIHPRRSQYLAQVLKLQDRYRLFLRHGVWGADYRRALNQSRIVLNYSICQVMNMRAYEAPACGALLFIEEANLEVRSVFRDRESCVLYNEANLLELLEYYLEHEDERAAIAAAGHRIVQDYTYERHFERLLVQIPALLQQLPAQRPVMRQTPRQRYLHALNQLSSSNQMGARSASARLSACWTELNHQMLIPDHVWELNALMVMLFPVFDENQELRQIYTVSLQELAKGFESALNLAPDNPVLAYHHGLICEYLEEETQALWSYSRSIELMAAGHAQELVAFRDFILPFNKSGRATDQLAFEWERISYEVIERGVSPASRYRQLLVSSIWQRIGRILARQGQRQKALIAYDNAFQNFPRASLLPEICRLQTEPEAVFASCRQMLQLQPLMASQLIDLISPELLLRHPDWIYQQTSLYLPLFPELLSLNRLGALVLAAKGLLPVDWRPLLDVPFSADFYQWLCLILQRNEALPALQALQRLRLPWGLNWHLEPEQAPELDLACGMYWTETGSAPRLGTQLEDRFQRVYAQAADPAQGRCGPDLFPFRFPEPSAASQSLDELVQGSRQLILAVLAGWSSAQLRELLAAFEAGWADAPDSLLLVWAPAGSELSLAQLEACLPEQMQAQLAWLDEDLSGADQAALLGRACLVLCRPQARGLFYSYWAAALQVPVCWIEAPGWLPDQGRGGFGLPAFAGPALALGAFPLAPPVPLPGPWRDPGLSRQAWLKGLWQLRLWAEFGDKPVG